MKLFKQGEVVYFEATGRDVRAVVIKDTGELRVTILIDQIGTWEMQRNLLRREV